LVISYTYSNIETSIKLIGYVGTIDAIDVYMQLSMLTKWDIMSIQRKVYAKLRDEQQRSGLEMVQFVAELDKVARQNIGAAYQFGSVLAELTQLYNKETVCRIVRRFKADHRAE